MIFDCIFVQVSWVRYRDVSLLAVGKFVYISDDRFKVLHEPNSSDWFLVIKSVTYKDEGIYECQVNSEPYKTFKFHLTVVGKLFIYETKNELQRPLCMTNIALRTDYIDKRSKELKWPQN